MICKKKSTAYFFGGFCAEFMFSTSIQGQGQWKGFSSFLVFIKSGPRHCSGVLGDCGASVSKQLLYSFLTKSSLSEGKRESVTEKENVWFVAPTRKKNPFFSQQQQII